MSYRAILAHDVHEPPPAARARNRVLVVDDDPLIAVTFQRLLERADFDVIVAEGGADGLRILQHDPTVGLVLLDLMMPGMDGWRFRHAQRADPRLAQIPTIIVTGTALADVVHAELQAADYLLKPVAGHHLVGVVSSYCRVGRS